METEAMSVAPKQAQKAIPQARNGLSVLKLCRGGLLEGRDGASLVVVDIEDGVELGQLQQVVDLLGQLEQFEGRALILDCGVGAHQFTQSRAIDIVHFTQIEQDALLSFGNQVANGVAQLHAAFAEGDPAAEFQNIDAIHFTGSYRSATGNSSLSLLRLAIR